MSGHILFDLIPTQPFESTTYHGGAEYAKAVFAYAIANNKADERIAVLVDPGRPIDPCLLEMSSRHGCEVCLVHGVAEVERLLNAGGFSVFYSAIPLKYRAISVRHARFIYTIHDLRPIVLPGDEVERHYGAGIRHRLACSWARRRVGARSISAQGQFRSLFRAAEDYRIVAGSRCTYDSLLTRFPELEGHVEVLYPPPIYDSEADTGILSELSLAHRGYYLLLSADRWKKNAYRALAAFEELYRERPSFDKKLLVVGASREIPFLARTQSAMIVQTGYVSRAQLEALFRSCFCLVYPSLHEGFGYPPLECMKYGVPVIASEAGAIPEVLGRAALFFDPRSVPQMKSRIEQVYDDPDLRDELGVAGRARFDLVVAQQRLALERLGDLILGGD